MVIYGALCLLLIRIGCVGSPRGGQPKPSVELDKSWKYVASDPPVCPHVLLCSPGGPSVPQPTRTPLVQRDVQGDHLNIPAFSIQQTSPPRPQALDPATEHIGLACYVV